LGLFDTIGFTSYNNSSELSKSLQDVMDTSPLYKNFSKINSKTPVFVLGALYNSDDISHIFSRIKQARLFFRSFDPNEQMRLSADDTIRQISQSVGVIIPLLSQHIADAKLHNLRGAFMAGLSTAMGKVTLMLQSGDSPIPIDYRDLVKMYKFPGQINGIINSFSISVSEAIHNKAVKDTGDIKYSLQNLDLGASSAENEYSNLMSYYLRTDEYRRVLRGEGRLVKGRKGSGKSAIFFAVRNAIRSVRNKIILDLKPEGYQLLEFKERVLEMLDRGTLEHTVTAFWEYVLLMEVCSGILKADRKFYTYDDRLTQAYTEMQNRYKLDSLITQGDFAERLLKLINLINNNYKNSFTNKNTLTNAEITQLLYQHDLDILKSDIANYMIHKEGLWILIDNIDKGWPTHGLKDIDVILIRCLLDACRKLEKWMEHRNIECHTTLFLRNDVYELLVNETADRGKDFVISVDWQDSDLLREVIRMRLVQSGHEKEDFFSLWHRFFVSHIDGEETSQYLIDRSLMRPRYLLNIINYCKSIAINLGHDKVEEEDIKKGISLFSKDCVFDINLEIRDVIGDIENVLYAFSGCSSQISEEELIFRIEQWAENVSSKKIIETLLWFGVIGVLRSENNISYIYNVDYDLMRLKALLTTRKFKNLQLIYTINPAFWNTLEIGKLED
jgi:hypothetical protein